MSDPDRPTRRAVVAGVAVSAAAVGALGVSHVSTRMPVVYLPHGGGPWPFVDLGFGDPEEWERMRAWLAALPSTLPEPPKAILVVSAHWEAPVPTVTTARRPPLLFDYHGFPPEAYRLTWPAPGDPALARRVRGLLEAAGLPSAEAPDRGYDHGTFVPLKVAWPGADVPTVQLSLVEGLDPATHLAIGRALAPLRDEGVFVVGSGMSFHDMRAFGRPAALEPSLAFDAWLGEVAGLEEARRDAQLLAWSRAPAARRCHPREEHLLPLMVVAGAAGADRGAVPFREQVMGAVVSALHFG